MSNPKKSSSAFAFIFCVLMVIYGAFFWKKVADAWFGPGIKKYEQPMYHTVSPDVKRIP